MDLSNKDTLDSLSRVQLQELAKQYGIKANLKSKAIIKQLCKLTEDATSTQQLPSTPTTPTPTTTTPRNTTSTPINIGGGLAAASPRTPSIYPSLDDVDGGDCGKRTRVVPEITEIAPAGDKWVSSATKSRRESKRKTVTLTATRHNKATSLAQPAPPRPSLQLTSSSSASSRRATLSTPIRAPDAVGRTALTPMSPSLVSLSGLPSWFSPKPQKTYKRKLDDSLIRGTFTWQDSTKTQAITGNDENMADNGASEGEGEGEGQDQVKGETKAKGEKKRKSKKKKKKAKATSTKEKTKQKRKNVADRGALGRDEGSGTSARRKTLREKKTSQRRETRRRQTTLGVASPAPLASGVGGGAVVFPPSPARRAGYVPDFDKVHERLRADMKSIVS